MNKHLTYAVALLVLSALACNAPLLDGADLPPTETPVGVDPTVAEVPPIEDVPPESPVPARSTSTPAAEGATVTPSPTNALPTPMVVCTPPLCSADEVYYCDGECPGGCGTRCATPTTASPLAPVILSFTADRTNIVQGERVALTWQATGGTEASICWVTREAILACVDGPIDPEAGAESVTPTAPGRPGLADMVLTVRSDSGADEAHVVVTIECVEDPLPALEDQELFGNCPYGTAVGAAAYQAFEGGTMVWLNGSQTIYVLYSDGRYESYADNFRDGDPESDPSIVPPKGLYQPVRGFGLVWRTTPAVRDGLGWALAPEGGFQGWSQSYSGTGMHNSGTYLRLVDGSIVLLGHFGGMWRSVGRE
jgi:hypothetical protein